MSPPSKVAGGTTESVSVWTVDRVVDAGGEKLAVGASVFLLFEGELSELLSEQETATSASTLSKAAIVAEGCLIILSTPVACGRERLSDR